MLTPLQCHLGLSFKLYTRTIPVRLILTYQARRFVRHNQEIGINSCILNLFSQADGGDQQLYS